MIIATRTPSRCSDSIASRDSGADLVLEREGADRLPVAHDVQGRLARPAGGRRGGLQLGRDRDRALLEEARSADDDRLAVDRGEGAATGQRFEAGGRAGGGTGTLRGGDDGPRERVLGIGFDGSRQGEHVVRLDTGRRDDGRDHRLALRERPGLVEDDGVELAGPLERDAVLHEQAVARAERRGDGDDERDREAERVGARDDQDGGGPEQRALGVAEQPPADERDHAGGEGHVEEECRRPVRQRLGAGRGCLGGGDHPHDPRQGGPLPDRRDRDAQGPAGGDRAGDDRVARALGDGARFAGDHRFVHIGHAVVDGPVGGTPDCRAGRG